MNSACCGLPSREHKAVSMGRTSAAVLPCCVMCCLESQKPANTTRSLRSWHLPATLADVGNGGKLPCLLFRLEKTTYEFLIPLLPKVPGCVYKMRQSAVLFVLRVVYCNSSEPPATA
ncbi:unnamed protein product [Ectocarpus sp. 13 AM-2016]